MFGKDCEPYNNLNIFKGNGFSPPPGGIQNPRLENLGNLFQKSTPLATLQCTLSLCSQASCFSRLNADYTQNTEDLGPPASTKTSRNYEISVAARWAFSSSFYRAPPQRHPFSRSLTAQTEGRRRHVAPRIQRPAAAAALCATHKGSRFPASRKIGT